MQKQQKLEIAIYFLGYVAIFILIFQVVVEIINDPATFQWDFKRYYFAGKLSLLDENPYDFEKMVLLFGEQLPWQLPFLYPPYTLIFFKPLARLSLENAYYLFFSLKLIAYMLLITIWKRQFFKDTSTPYFLLFIFGSMGSEAIVMDLYAGNISAFQQLLFWCGIALLLKKQITASGACIVCASSVKFFVLTPLLLIFLAAGYWRHFFLFGGIFATLLVGVFVHSPTYFDVVVKNNIQQVALRETGHPAISIRNILHDLSSFHNLCLNPDILYGIIVICIVACSVYVIMTNISFLRKKTFLLVNFIVISNCLIVPLLKNYEQVILIPPTFYLFDYLLKKKHFIMIYFLFLLYFIFTDRTVMFLERLTGMDLQYSVQSSVYFIMNYHVLFALIATWIMYLFVIEKESINVTS